ncbi:MAG: hypothetical protein OIF38_14155, partial [Cellvibrionaceae bacterium]|nr:hypothetical protein [Cellvibrionaceae bacterium]
GKLIPYANETQYSWSQSTVKIPTRLWEQSARLIPADLQTLIEQAKQENAALKWVEVWPLTDELSKFYSPSTGWRKKEQ